MVPSMNPMTSPPPKTLCKPIDLTCSCVLAIYWYVTNVLLTRQTDMLRYVLTTEWQSEAALCCAQKPLNVCHASQQLSFLLFSAVVHSTRSWAMRFNVVSGRQNVMLTSNMCSVSDDFDAYFKRAAELHAQTQIHHPTTPAHQSQQQLQQEEREEEEAGGRDNVPPNRRSSSTERRRTSSVSVRHKRTASCRYPQRRPTVTVTREQSSPPNEQTPLTAHSAQLNDRSLLCKSVSAVFRMCKTGTRGSTAFLFQENRMRGTDRRTDKRTVCNA